MEANVALTGQRVVDALKAMAARRPLPKAITVDHGTECTSKALDEWPIGAESPWTSFDPASPWRTRLSRVSMARRPHGALGHLTPSEYAEQRQQPSSEAATLQLAPVW